MNIVTRHPEPHNVHAMKRIWQSSFSDNQEYVDMFFESCYQPEQTIVAYGDMKPAGMAFLLPVQLKKQDRSFFGYYLYAVCVKPGFRGLGIMRHLEFAAKNVARSRNMDFLCLVPQSEELIKLYEKLSYHTAFYLTERNFQVFPEAKADGVKINTCSPEDYARLREYYLSQKEVVLDFIPQTDEYNYRYLEFRKSGGDICRVRLDGEEHFLAGYIKGDTYIVKETSLLKEQLKRVLPLFAQKYNTALFKVSGLKGAVDAIKPYGMFKWINDEMYSTTLKSLNPYMNMMLD